MKTQILILSTLLLLSCSNDENETNIAPVAEDIVLSLSELLTEDIVATVSATDANEDDVLTYSIVSQTPQNAMLIDANDGRLFVNDATVFDYEPYAEVNAVVEISDGELTTSINVEITLLDVPGPENGLLAYYPFEDLNLNDVSGNSNHAINASSENFVKAPNTFGKLNSSYIFDGNYARIPSFGTNIDNFTISLWAYQDSNLSNLLGEQTMVAKAGAGREYVMRLQNRYANAHFYNSMYYHTTSDAVVPSDQWFHYALKVENSVWSIYINGVLVKSVTQSANISWNSNSVLIGALTTSGTERFFGKLDDILFYNRPLSNNEILAIANNLF